MASKSIFATVGTTKFDELCQTVLTSECLRSFKNLGYTKLSVQIGNSEVFTENIPEEGVEVTVFKFKNDIIDEINKADLVISHAGAGTILEVLSLKKPLLVVINTNLMDNHQVEIAEQLHIEKHLYYCTCDTLVDTLETVDFSILQPYPKADTRLFYEYLNNFMGLKSKR